MKESKFRACEELYATATKALNTQIEINNKLKAENKQLRSIKCPPISDGDSCICPIEELEAELMEANKQIDKARNYLWGKKAGYVKGLEERIKVLEQLLIEYGRHGSGCSTEFGKKYRCRCGWDKEKQAINS